MTEKQNIKNIFDYNTCHVTCNSKCYRESGLNILYFNAVSMRNKFDDISLFIDTFKHKIHIIIICETRLKDGETITFNINNYNAYHSTRNNKYRGAGCAIYIHKSIISTQIFEQCINEQNFLVTKLTRENINIIAIYRPPSTNITLFFESLTQLLIKYPNSIIAGDINLDILKNNNNTVKKYFDIIHSSGFSILNKININSATRTTSDSKTIIDHIITDLLTYKFNIAMEDLSFSDHKYLKINFKKIQQHVRTPNKIIKKNILDYKLINITDFENKISQCNSFNDLITETKKIIDTNSKTICIKTRNKKNHGFQTNCLI